MQKVLLFLLIFSILGITDSQAQNNKNVENKLVGIWEYQGARNSQQYDLGFQKGQPAMFKTYRANHTFANFNWSKPHAIISSKGTWRLTSDSTLRENVKASGNKNLIGEGDDMTFKIKDGKYLYIKWLLEKNAVGNKVDLEIEELWRKVELAE